VAAAEGLAVGGAGVALDLDLSRCFASLRPWGALVGEALRRSLRIADDNDSNWVEPSSVSDDGEGASAFCAAAPEAVAPALGEDFAADLAAGGRLFVLLCSGADDAAGVESGETPAAPTALGVSLPAFSAFSVGAFLAGFATDAAADSVRAVVAAAAGCGAEAV